MRFMTYNIQSACAAAHNPGRRPEGYSLMGIADVIRAQAPDIVALQEVDRGRKRSSFVDQVGWLGEQLGYCSAFAPAFDSDEGGGRTGEYGNALLTRFPVSDWRVDRLWGRTELWPGEPSWVIEPRCCFSATVTADAPVRVMGLHLSTTRDQREHQLADVARLVTEAAGLPTVLMGDFNAGCEELMASPLSCLLTNVMIDTPANTFPNGLKAKAMIDHIWISSHWEVEAAWVVSERMGRSDHNPVVADLRLKL